MKAKLLTRINALIATLVSLLGFTSCGNFLVKYGAPVEYGTPFATWDVSGKVSDEENNPIENAQVIVRSPKPGQIRDTLYSDEEGLYRGSYPGVFPYSNDSIDIVVRDTAGVYASDSVRVAVEYDKSEVADDDSWNRGTAYIQQDFQLKKVND